VRFFQVVGLEPFHLLVQAEQVIERLELGGVSLLPRPCPCPVVDFDEAGVLGGSFQSAPYPGRKVTPLFVIL